MPFDPKLPVFAVRIDFPIAPDRDPDPEEAENVFWEYLVALKRNGQTLGECIEAYQEGLFCVYTSVPHPCALQREFDSLMGSECLNEVVRITGCEPEWTVLADHSDAGVTDWRSSSSLFLYANLFEATQPIRCGETGLPVPLYLLPIPQETREHLVRWAEQYARHDHLFIDSGALERPAYEELADPNSELSEYGCALRAEV